MTARVVGLARDPQAQTKFQRLKIANEFLRVIAGCGRRFFEHKGEISQLTVDARGRIWLWDSYTKRRVYTAYRGRWRHFTNGGTLRRLIEHLCEFIHRGTPIPHCLGPWPETYCDGDLWGWGDN